MDEQTQALFHDMISRCLAQEVAPFYDQWEADGEIPRSLWLALGAAGLLGIDLDETYGGSGADIAITQLVLEEMSRQGFGGLASAYNIH
ncbi:MAG: acyl-CoA dehydrogenase family protein, partial [Halomonas venusta]|nr:acyl-CoA dehydrogenase family protein [Halomonas venusta]